MRCTFAWHPVVGTNWIRGEMTPTPMCSRPWANPDQMLERLRLASEAAIETDAWPSAIRRLINHVTSSLQQSTYLQA